MAIQSVSNFLEKHRPFLRIHIDCEMVLCQEFRQANPNLNKLVLSLWMKLELTCPGTVLKTM